MSALLDGVHIVELAGELGDTCPQLLASLGATLTRASAAHELAPLLARADILIEYQGAARMQALGLSPEQIAERHPRLIHASLTAFGSYGPYAQFRGAELVCSALGGVLRMVGEPDRAPVKEALDACLFHAHTAAAAASMLAYQEREHSGRGQHVDISVQEVAASRLTNAIVLWQFDRRLLERSGDQLRYGRAAVRCIWPLRDGYAFHSLLSGRFGAPANAALSAWLDELGYDNPLRDVDWLRYDRSALPAATRAHWQQALARFFSERSKAEIASEGRRRGINAAVLNDPEEVLQDPQLTARGLWRSVERAGRSLRMPGPWLHVRGAVEGHGAIPGHGRERAAGAGPSERAAGATTAAHSGAVKLSTSASTAPALAGLKVLDLSWALVGSLTTKALGDYGACVVKLESSRRLCLTRLDVQVARSSANSFDDKPWFAQLNTSKLGLQLDLKHPRAREVLEPLIDWADVVVENFSPGTLEKLGLDFATLSARRPELIMASASAYGQTGPLRESWGVDGTIAALSSRMLLTGWPDRGPVLPGALPYADVVVPQVLVAALLAALAQRRRTGCGCHLDVSMYEVAVHQMARALEAAQLGAASGRAGNRAPSVFHQGVYPTRGADRWIAISLFGSDDYQRLIDALGGIWPAAALVAAGDAAQRERLDEQLAARTRAHDEHAIMLQLQAAGVAAGVVQDASDLLQRDPQLRARGAWVTLDHAKLGAFEHQSTPYQLARTPAQPAPAPLLGEHTELICRQIAGISAAAYAALREAGLFT